jgi:hypothetical protein
MVTGSVESLRRASQEFLDLWAPGAVVTVDWTGDAFLLQVARGYRLADPIWLTSERGANGMLDVGLARELLAAAWILEHGPPG